MTKAPILAGLFALAASVAWAQANAGNLDGTNLDPGSSGGAAGLISGGGTVTSNIDGRDTRPVPDARTGGARAQTKADTDSKDDRAARKTAEKAARARAEGELDDSGKPKRAKKETRNQRVYSYPYVQPFGFSLFGSRGYPR